MLTAEASLSPRLKDTLALHPCHVTPCHVIAGLGVINTKQYLQIIVGAKKKASWSSSSGWIYILDPLLCEDAPLIMFPVKCIAQGHSALFPVVTKSLIMFICPDKTVHQSSSF